MANYEVVMDEAEKSMTSGVAKGAIGGALFGGIGALAGASSGKAKSVYTVRFRPPGSRLP